MQKKRSGSIWSVLREDYQILLNERRIKKKKRKKQTTGQYEYDPIFVKSVIQSYISTHTHKTSHLCVSTYMHIKSVYIEKLMWKKVNQTDHIHD